ncbi:MAG: nuclear transport factor 2 family protein [Bacteroidales bacterium]|nr:nuclear transport factor 2 family protein [Bacteroidales bacterium]
MKNKILMGGFLMLTVTLSLAFTQKKEKPTVDKDQVKSEIQAIEDHFALTFNNRNADSITYYAEDAISYFAGQEPIVGIDAIHQHIKDELMDFPEGAKISFETLEIYVTDDGNSVAEIGTHKLVDSTGIIIQKGHYVSFFAKRDGKYVCIRDMANSVQIDK